MKTRDLIPFLLISFIIAWGVLALYIFAAPQMERHFGPLTGSHPLFYLAVWAPAIAALLVVGLRHRLTGLGLFLRRLSLGKSHIAWWALLLIGLPAVFYMGAFIKEGALSLAFPFTSLGAYVSALLLMAIKGPVEEIGWRGLALPLLQRRMAPLWAALLIGLIWGVWHLPAFLLSGLPQSAWSFGHFFVGVMALSVLVTGLFNQSRGSIGMAALFHWQLINPLWPDAQPYDTWLLVCVALCVFILNRQMFLSRGGAVTEVLAS